MGDTIFAAATGMGPSAIAIIRISGPQTADAIHRICRTRLEARRASRVNFVDAQTGCLIDRGLALWFPGPRSFTGEESAEFHIHGGRAVVQAMLRTLATLERFRPAKPGEFTRRAFVNGKLDLTEAEGIGDIVAAETQAQLTQALAISGGGLKNRVQSWRSALIASMAYVAADIDFSDEGDVPNRLDPKVFAGARGVADEIRAILRDGRRGEIVRDGFSVVITGPPNVGKSSLLNAIARRDIAIVSSQAGTTRDLIEVCLDIDGVPVNLVDTAGLREVSDEVENEGIRRAHHRARHADLVLWVSETDARMPVPGNLFDPAKVVAVFSKADLCAGNDSSGFAVSAISGFGINELLDEVRLRAENAIQGPSPALLTRERHRTELSMAVEALTRIDTHGESSELVAEDLRVACLRLESVVGGIDVETVLGEIFSRFCIGK